MNPKQIEVGRHSSILDVAAAMEKVRMARPWMSSEPLWWDDAETNQVLNAGVAAGHLYRPSTTQVEWTESGVEALKVARAAERERPQNVIYSANEAAGGGGNAGFWSNEHGWVEDLSEATRFTDGEKASFNLPLSRGGDAKWSLASNFDPSLSEQANKQEATGEQGRDPVYNTQFFPTLICIHGNWGIYTNFRGRCAAIPTRDAAAAGCKASQFGDLAHVKKTLPAEFAAWEDRQRKITTAQQRREEAKSVGYEEQYLDGYYRNTNPDMYEDRSAAQDAWTAGYEDWRQDVGNGVEIKV